MKQLLRYFIFSLLPLAAQEPYDLNQYGKGIIDAKGAEEIDKEWHAPIKLTLVVRDEEGKPVADAISNVGIDSSLHMDGHNNFKGKTDENGRFVVEARGGGSSDILLVKEGYYPSRPDVEWNDKRNLDFENIKKIGFQPWNQTVDVLLKKIGKPIPMIVRIGGKSYGHPPLHGADLGWDLMEADWMPPHGNGKKSDLILKFDGRFEYGELHSYSSLAQMDLSFANDNDGFIPIFDLKGEESLLEFPREAPDGGYSQEKLKFLSQQTESGHLKRIPEPEPKGYLIPNQNRGRCCGQGGFGNLWQNHHPGQARSPRRG